MKLILYCKTSVPTTPAFFAFKNILGYEKVKVYDGAFNDECLSIKVSRSLDIGSFYSQVSRYFGFTASRFRGFPEGEVGLFKISPETMIPGNRISWQTNLSTKIQACS